MSTPDFAKGASGPGNQYAGLGRNLAYLGGASASASSSSGSGTTGTSFPASPSDAQMYTYVADATNGVLWLFRYYTTGAYWAFVGGPPLVSEVTTSETTTSATYAALATPGPSIVLPFAADYDVSFGANLRNTGVANASSLMSYDIGGTGAVDADGVRHDDDATGQSFNGGRWRRKPGLTAVTLTAKYRIDSGATLTAQHRWMAVWPVKK